jgi:hypothetical protein
MAAVLGGWRGVSATPCYRRGHLKIGTSRAERVGWSVRGELLWAYTKLTEQHLPRPDRPQRVSLGQGFSRLWRGRRLLLTDRSI